MRDYPGLTLFAKEGHDFVELSRPVVGVMPCTACQQLDENVAEGHRLLTVAESRFETHLVYGEADSEEHVFFLCNADAGQWDELREFLVHCAHNGRQDGFIIASPNRAVYVQLRPHRNSTAITRWNNTAEKLDDWLDLWFWPGFKTKGHFPRSHLYVMKKLRDHGL